MQNVPRARHIDWGCAITTITTNAHPEKDSEHWSFVTLN